MKLEADLAALTARAASLNSKRTAAQTALDSAMKARQKHLLDGDLDDAARADKLQSASDSAGSALAGFDGAIGALAESIAQVEAQLAVERQKAEREAAATTLATETAALEKLLAPWLTVTRDLAAAAANVGHVHFEAEQIGGYLRNAASEIEAAVAATVGNLRASVTAIGQGHHAVPRRAAAFEPVKAEPKPELVQLFAMQHVVWADHNGQQRRAGRFTDIEVSPEQAARALRKALAIPINDPRRRELCRQAGGHPDPRCCKSLDADEPETESTPVPQPEDTPAATPFIRGRAGEPYVIIRHREAQS